MEKQPRSSVLPTLTLGTVLDAVKFSDSEEVSGQDIASAIVEYEESCCMLYSENVYTQLKVVSNVLLYL